MSNLIDDVQKKCLAEFDAEHVECTGDLSSCTVGQAKLELTVVSANFKGVPLLARHRKINKAVDEYMDQIHALTINAWTPAQYESKR